MEKYSFKKIYQVLVSTVSPWHLSYALFSYPSHPISVLLEALPWRLTVAGEASMTAVLPPHRLRSGANRYLPERTGCWHFSFPPVPHHRSPIPGSHGWLRGRLPSPHPAPTLGIASLRSLTCRVTVPHQEQAEKSGDCSLPHTPVSIQRED